MTGDNHTRKYRATIEYINKLGMIQDYSFEFESKYILAQRGEFRPYVISHIEQEGLDIPNYEIVAGREIIDE
jgi:hypothetical protein